VAFVIGGHSEYTCRQLWQRIPETYRHCTTFSDQRQHLARIGDQAKYEILDGTHFIYLDNVDLISEITDEFLSDISV
jgi:hypothetical protein